MASRSDGYMYSINYSSSFEIGYYKKINLWNKKIGSRDFNTELFINTTPENDIYHIPKLLCDVLNNLHEKSNIVNELRTVDTINTKLGNNPNTIWLYNMKIDNYLPATARDIEYIYRYVRKFIEKYFDNTTIEYLNKDPDIPVYFFIWYFTTPDIFNINMRSKNKYCEWESILLKRIPIYVPQNVSNILNIKNDYESLYESTNNLLKLEKEKNIEVNNINVLIKSVHPTCYLDEKNHNNYKMKLQQCMTCDTDFYVGAKNTKILHGFYENYVYIMNKINIEKIENIGDTFWDRYGTPPSSPPKVEIQSEDCLMNSKICYGCINKQPNQLAHMDEGGCLNYSSEEEDFEYF
tara:strand:- start:50 stop:1099 length:1050 start_codon:yes stop_codon:yes gene_type:complete